MPPHLGDVAELPLREGVDVGMLPHLPRVVAVDAVELTHHHEAVDAVVVGRQLEVRLPLSQKLSQLTRLRSLSLRDRYLSRPTWWRRWPSRLS